MIICCCLYKNSCGFSLVQALVSLAISALILTGVVNIVVSSKQTFLYRNELSFIQENARLALEILSRDIRLAGYTGCAHLPKHTNSKDAFYTLSPLKGYEGSASAKGFPREFRKDAAKHYHNLSKGSDAVVVRFAKLDQSVDIHAHDSARQIFRLHGRHRFSRGAKLVAVDGGCRHVELLLTRKISAKTLAYSPQTPLLGLYKSGAKIMPWVARGYYIGPSSVIAGMPALKRRSLSSTGRTRVEELVQGVEDMEILYGLKSADDTDTIRYVGADQVSDWRRVGSLRLELILRSQAALFDKKSEVERNGISYDDRFLRINVGTTVNVRNHQVSLSIARDVHRQKSGHEGAVN